MVPFATYFDKFKHGCHPRELKKTYHRYILKIAVATMSVMMNINFTIHNIGWNPHTLCISEPRSIIDINPNAFKSLLQRS